MGYHFPLRTWDVSSSIFSIWTLFSVFSWFVLTWSLYPKSAYRGWAWGACPDCQEPQATGDKVFMAFSMIPVAMLEVEEMVMMEMMIGLLTLRLPRGLVKEDGAIDVPAHRQTDFLPFFFSLSFNIYFLDFYFIWDIGLYLRTSLYFCFYFETCSYLQLYGKILI